MSTPDAGLRYRRISDPLGIEILGLDLRQPLNASRASLLRQLFDEHLLLLFRDQELSEEDQRRTCAYLRPVVEPTAWISNVVPGFHPEGELQWHCDYAFTPDPMLGLSLYAIEIASGAVPTRFANNALAHDTLPHDLRQALDGLRVVHCIDTVTGRDNVRTRLDDVGGTHASPLAYPRHARPVIWTHPITHKPLLFVLAQQASHFEGWSCDASDVLLDQVFAHLYQPANVYEHEWRVGDFVVWDNLALQHGRAANANTIQRSLRRLAMNTKTTKELTAGTGFDPDSRAGLEPLRHPTRPVRSPAVVEAGQPPRIGHPEHRDVPGLGLTGRR